MTLESTMTLLTAEAESSSGRMGAGSVPGFLAPDGDCHRAVVTKAIVRDPVKVTIRGEAHETKRTAFAERFSFGLVDFTDFASLASAIAILRDQWHSTLIYGAPLPGMEDFPTIGRRKNPKPGKGACIDDDYRTHVIILDIDKLLLPARLRGWEDPEACARWTWRRICKQYPAFEGVKAVWCASNSAAVRRPADDDDPEGPKKSDYAKFHFWCLSDTMLGRDDLRLLAEGWEMIDRSVFDSIQVHYTARPWCQHPEDDPLLGKPNHGVIGGTAEAVRWIDVETLAMRRMKAAGKERRAAHEAPKVTLPYSAADAPEESSRMAKGAKRKMLAGFADESDSHDKIVRWSVAVGAMVASHEMTEADADEIRRAALETGGGANRKNEGPTWDSGYKFGMGKGDGGARRLEKEGPWVTAAEAARDDRSMTKMERMRRDLKSS